MRPLRIAMIGLRGLPATHGGIERHVEEIGSRLAERGRDVVAFCRPAYSDTTISSYRGMSLRFLPTPSTRGIEALVHSGLSTLATVGRGYDVAHFHALGPGLFTPISRGLTRAAVVQTIHGMDDQRAKWGGGAQSALRVGAWLSARVPHEVIVVSRALQEHYAELGRPATYVSNGVPPVAPVDDGELARFGLTRDGYAVFVGRLVPEKDPRLLIEAYRDVATDLPLVIVGDSSHTDDYVAELHRLARPDARVRLVGYQHGPTLTSLMGGARVMVQPSLLEGLPITLLEAAAQGVPVLASDIAPHHEVVRSEGAGRRLFPVTDKAALTQALNEMLGTDPEILHADAEVLRADAVRRYDWDVATDLVEQTYARALSGRSSRRQSVP